VTEEKFAQEELDAITALFRSASHLTRLKVSWGKVQFELSKPAGHVKVEGPLELPAPVKPVAPVILRSQRIGTFFRAATPGSGACVDVGATVRPDSIIGRIDVLRRTHPVSAGLGGRVIEILVDDGQTVEFGQPLAMIEPDR
jgi:acetyl-CoA carboxylase biotin carboxyl carrier protein